MEVKCKPITYMFLNDFLRTERRPTVSYSLARDLLQTFLEMEATYETFQKSGKRDSLKQYFID